MRTFRHVIVGVLLVIGALTLFAFLLPRQLHLERSASIAASPEVVFELLDTPQRYKQFYPSYSAQSPPAEELSGPPAGAGARVVWTSGGSPIPLGDHLIIAAQPNRSVRVAVAYRGKAQGTTSWVIAEEGEGSRVTWAFDTDFGGDPFFRYRGLGLKGDIERFLADGMARLKSVAEARAARLAAIEAGPRVVDVPACDIVFRRLVIFGDATAFSRASDEAYAQLREFAASHGLEIDGAPLAITNFSDATRWDVDAGLRVRGSPAALAAAGKVTGTDIHLAHMDAQRAVRAIHLGSYATVGETFFGAIEYARRHGLAPVGRSWGEYVSDPSAPKEDLVTNLYIPVS